MCQQYLRMSCNLNSNRPITTCHLNCLIKWLLLLNFIFVLLLLLINSTLCFTSDVTTTLVKSNQQRQIIIKSSQSLPPCLNSSSCSSVPPSSLSSPSPHHRIHRRDSLFELQSSSSQSSSNSALSSTSSILQHNSAQQQYLQLYDHVPYFVQEPYGSVRLSNQYGGIIPCSVALVNTVTGQSTSGGQQQANNNANSVPNSNKPTSNLIERIYWEVRDIRTLDDSHFNPAIDLPGLREHRSDGSLAFLPFGQESSLVSTELHNALYRCVAVTTVGTIASRSILVTLVFEKPSIVVRSFDATATEGNDAILKCTVNSELYSVVAWHTDDGDIFLPFDQHTTYIPLDTRHYVLPSGELLVASVRSTDVRRQFRCRVGHMLTGERVDSANWARIKISDKSSHISYRPRFNLNASLRQTLTIDDSAHHYSPSPVDLYCSFDGQPPPNISWYFISYQQNTTTRQQQQQQQLILSSTELASSTSSASPSLSSLLNNRRIVSLRHLRINQPGVADLGTYVCIANNSHFEVRHETDLLLRSMLQVNLTSSAQPNLPFLPGDSVTLTCNVTTTASHSHHLFDGLDDMQSVLNSRFIITYLWYHNLSPIFEDNGGHVYVDSKSMMTSGKSSGHHNYYASHYGGVGGNNNHGGAHIEKLDKNVLRIRDLRYSDSGVYQCFVRLTGPDYQEWLQATAVIAVKQSPPSLLSTFNEQILIADNELSLKCTATGIPAPTIVWQRNGINLTDYTANLVNSHQSGGGGGNSLYRYKTGATAIRPPSSNSPDQTPQQYSKLLQEENIGTISYLNISNIRPQDVGLFRCLAINAVGVVTHQARISVIGSPYVQPIGDVTAVQGQPVTVTCAYSGYPIEEVFFLKGKRRLPYDERHVITSLGSLTISQVDKADEDEYTCVVVGENGLRSEQPFRFLVVVPPLISPFIFSDALEEGMRATAVCSVVSGDAPIQLTWLKDGQPLLAHSRSDTHVQVLNIKEFISSLIISNITRRHQGSYTCLASSPYTSSNRTAVMLVKAPPKWLIKPSNQFAISSTLSQSGNSNRNGALDSNSGRHHQSLFVRFDCLATGNPTPVIRWKFLRPKNYHNKNSFEVQQQKQNDPSQYDSVPILSSPQIHVLENGSLLIRSLDKVKYEGVYLCEVSNGVGKPLETRASLVIHNSPQISLKILPHSSSGGGDVPQHVSQSSIDESLVQLALRRDSQVSLSCTGGGVLPLSINWYKNGHEISVFDTASITATGSFRVFESTKQSPTDRQFGERTSNLILKHLTRSDSAQYVCMARNVYGQSVKSVLLQVLEPPDAPEALKAIEVGSRTVTLSWAVAYTGNLPLLSQNIEYKKEADKTWHNALMIKSNTNTVTVHGLQPLTPYEFRVSFVNELGNSEHSRSITLTTQMEAPTVMPDNLRATPLSTHAIRLTWSIRLPAPDSPEIEVIDGFYIGYRAVAGSGMTQSDTPSSYTYKTITNSPMQQLYSKLLLNPSSMSSSSWQNSKYRQGSVPAPSVEYLKMAPSDSSPGSNSNNMHHQYYEHIVDILIRQTQYQFVVQAFNEKGAGPTSVEVTARTYTHDPPKAPNFRIDNVSTHEALLSWDYGSSVQMQTSSSSSASSSSSSSSSSLSNNQVMDSGPLLVDGYVISYHVSSVKQHDNNNYYGAGGGDKLLMDTAELVSSNGQSESNSKDDNWQSVTISSPSTSSFTIRNLRCGTEYIARIEAFNEMGSGKPSDLLRFSTLGTVPIPPDKYSRQFIMSNITYVTINLDQWSDGGCAISGYSIKYRSRRMHYHRSVQQSSSTNNNPSNGWITLSTHLMPEKDMLIIRDLQPGTWHDLILSAQNDAGKREAEFSFATLTETGATVEPLHAFESRMGNTFGSSSYTGSLFGALFEDPMIFIPALCTLIVLLVVASTSAFLYVMRIRHETLQMTSGEETYCSHRANSRSDDLSLNSYPNCHSNGQNGKLGPNGNNKLMNGNNAATLYDKGMSAESEPLYEQTNFGHNKQQQLNYQQQQQQQVNNTNKSPLHRNMNLMKQMSNENLLDSLPSQQQQAIALMDAANTYGFVKGPPMFETLRDPNKQFKTLGRTGNNNQNNQLSSSSTSSSSTKHLYQMPEQVKQEANALLTLKRAVQQAQLLPNQQIQQQVQQQSELIEINGPLGPLQFPNSYMTTFGMIRANQNNNNDNDNCFE